MLLALQRALRFNIGNVTSYLASAFATISVNFATNASTWTSPNLA